MIGSKLAEAIIPAHFGNYTMYREGNIIKEITIHHMAARWTAERCGQSFQEVGRDGSSHYGIGYNGEIAQYVSEEDTAWTNGNWESNLRSITIECANESAGDPWKVSDATMESLVRLIADIAQRNNLGFLVKGVNLTWHSMFAATVCPGPYLLSKIDEIVEKVNMLLSGDKKMHTEAVGCTYQVYTDNWLPKVTGSNQNDSINGYAGNIGQPISGVYIECTKGNVFYRAHQMNGSWLPEVKNLEDYAGNLGKPIDKIMIRSDVTTIHYQVHTKENGWLPEVMGYNARDHLNGYAGNVGEAIDALIVRADPIVSIVENVGEEEKNDEIPSVPIEDIVEPPKESTETTVFEEFDTSEPDYTLNTTELKTSKILLAIINFVKRILSMLKGEK